MTRILSGPTTTEKDKEANEPSEIYDIEVNRIYNKGNTDTVVNPSDNTIAVQTGQGTNFTIGKLYSFKGFQETFRVDGISTDTLTVTRNYDNWVNTLETVPSGIEIYETEWVRFTDAINMISITFAGIVYSEFPIERDDIATDVTGRISTVKIRGSNVNLQLSAYMASGDMRGFRVRVRKVFRNLLSDPNDAIVLFVGIIDSVSANEATLELDCVDRMDILIPRIPYRTYSNRCPWVFKGKECQYDNNNSTSFTECPKTFTACEARFNVARFGGFSVN